MTALWHSPALGVLSLIGVAACAQEATSRNDARSAPGGAALRVQIDGAPASLALQLERQGDQVIGVESDSMRAMTRARRLLIRPAQDPASVHRLCGVLATATPRAIVVDWGAPVDTTQPPLAVRSIEGRDVRGIRFLLPGTDAQYVFEGISRQGARVSVHWPIRAARAVPASATDAVIESSVTPSPLTLDSLIHALRVSGPASSPRTTEAFAPLREGAVRVESLIPRYDVTLEAPCTDITVAIPVVARIDHRVRLRVPPRSTVDAVASATDGAVRVAFEEASASVEPKTRESVPTASIVADTAGQVTLRVRVQVVPRSQPAGQVVLVRIRATAPVSSVP